MADDEKIQLLLELLGFEKVEDAISSMQHLKGAIGETKDELGSVEREASGATWPETLGERIERLKSQQKQLAADFAEGKVDLQDYAKDSRSLTSDLAACEKAQRALDDATKTTTITTAELRQEARNYLLEQEAATAGTIRADVAFQSFARAGIDVATGRVYGLAGQIANLTEALGGPGGLGLAIGIAALAFYELAPKIGEAYNELTGYNKAVKDAKSYSEQLADRIKELNEKPLKVRAEIEELERAKEQVTEIKAALEAVEKLRKAEPPPVKAAGQRIAEILGTQWGGTLTEHLIESEEGRSPLQGQMAHAGLELQKTRDYIRKTLGFNRAEEAPVEVQRVLEARERELKNLQDRARNEAETNIGALYNRAVSGDPVAREQLAAQLAGIGETGLAGRVRGATPEAIQRDRLEKVSTGFLQHFHEKTHRAQEDIDKERAKAAKASLDAQADEVEDQVKAAAAFSKKAAREQAANEADIEHEATRLNREAKAAATKAAQRQTPDQIAAQTLASQIAQANGVPAGQAAGIAQRSMELQRAGVDAATATREAMLESQVAMSGAVELFETLKRNADMQAAAMRRMLNAMGRANQPAALNFGFQ